MARSLPDNVIELYPQSPALEGRPLDYTPETVLLNAMFLVLSREQQLKITRLIFDRVRQDRNDAVLLGALKAADRMWGV